jgi:hypothetical protein
MLNKTLTQSLVLALFGGLLSTTVAQALPGQTVEEVQAWMNSNPTVRPKVGERLTVRRRNSAAQHFTFEASIFIPGTLSRGKRDDGRIHGETYSLFDVQNGITPARLEESLRAIYGLEVGKDFDRATVAYKYPVDKTPKFVVGKGYKNNYLQGEVRKGEQFAYWLELAQTDKGVAYSGRVAIFLLDDLESVLTKVQNY